MNEDVIEMIGTLRARLDDLEAVVRESPVELVGYASKLDDLDTQVYVFQTKIERMGEGGAEEATASESSESSGFKIPEGVKEGMTDAVHAAGDLARDMKPVVSEITGTMNEIKDAFGISGRSGKTKFRR